MLVTIVQSLSDSTDCGVINIYASLRPTKPPKCLAALLKLESKYCLVYPLLMNRGTQASTTWMGAPSQVSDHTTAVSSLRLTSASSRTLDYLNISAEKGNVIIVLICFSQAHVIIAFWVTFSSKVIEKEAANFATEPPPSPGQLYPGIIRVQSSSKPYRFITGLFCEDLMTAL